MANPQPPLDPRKYPYHSGDVVTLSFKKNGFVLDFSPAYFEVMWMRTHDVELPKISTTLFVFCTCMSRCA